MTDVVKCSWCSNLNTCRQAGECYGDMMERMQTEGEAELAKVIKKVHRSGNRNRSR